MLPSIMNAIIISFIISFKTNIRVPLPPIDREAQDQCKASIASIKKAISNFNWKKTFENPSINGKVELLNEILLIITFLIINYYRQPPWMTDNIRKHIKKDLDWQNENGQSYRMVREEVIMIKFG